MAATLDKYRDLFNKKAFAHVATIGAGGKPQVTPVWVDYDGTHIRFNTARGRVKDRNLKKNPQVALSIQDPDNPYRYVQVRGRVDGEPALDGLEGLPDAPGRREPVGVVHEDVRVVELGDARAVEVAEDREAVAELHRDVAEAGRLAGDTELELGGPVAVAADDDGPLHAVVEDARRMRVGADVLGAAARAAEDTHPVIVSHEMTTPCRTNV